MSAGRPAIPSRSWRRITIGRSQKSKKRSVTKRRDEEPTFFVDASMGRSLGRRLAAEGLRVVLHDDEFEQGTPDQEWLPVVGARGWVVLTKDSRLRFRPLEKEALIAANVRVFVFTGATF